MSQQIALTPSTASSHQRSNVLALLVVAVLGLGFFGTTVWFVTRTYVSSFSVSPDGKLRAEIVDRSFQFIDRNFTMRIVDDKGNSRVLFRSPDESPIDISHDRLQWSNDSKRVLLVGRFFSRQDAEIADGQFLYLLCDVETGEVWCNSEQRVGPGFDRERLEGFDLKSLTP